MRRRVELEKEFNPNTGCITVAVLLTKRKGIPDYKVRVGRCSIFVK